MIVPPPPPKDAVSLPYGSRLRAGLGEATILADMDFETYSECDLKTEGVQNYAEHPSTEVLCFAYDLKDGKGARYWQPGFPNPQDLFDHLASGKLIEAFNSTFEERIWNHVCTQKYDWPPLPVDQLRCAAAKSRAFCIAPNLENAVKCVGVKAEKDNRGKALLNRFSKPRKPTKNNPSTRNCPLSDPKFSELIEYNIQDIVAEAELSAKVPDLPQSEFDYWKVDQECNRTGVRLDMVAIDKCIQMLDEAYASCMEEVTRITNGRIKTINQSVAIRQWLAENGIDTPSVDSDHISALLERPDLPVVCRKVLEAKRDLGSASVKKVYAMKAQANAQGRVYDQFKYHGARTGRDVGTGIQFQNMPNSGPDVKSCECGAYFSLEKSHCPKCGCDAGLTGTVEWDDLSAEFAIEAIKTGQFYFYFNDLTGVLSGCLRGFLMSDEGHDFICSDYSSIEAVVAACLAGEQWRIEAFSRKQDIYLLSISKMTGIPYEEYVEHKKREGAHHAHRKLGKVAELASGYGGWIGAWKQFGADSFFNGDEDIKQNILAWRKASPAIVNAWGGQYVWEAGVKRPKLYGLEGAFVKALMLPEEMHEWRAGVGYIKKGQNVYCVLPSGRAITYHQARLDGDKIRFKGWNTNPKMGPMGWVTLDTYGGRLFENVVQAVARDIMAHAAVKLNNAGYKVKLRVHDELATQVPEGWGSVEEMERIAADLPHWAAGWPVRAAGGWRGKRYRK